MKALIISDDEYVINHLQSLLKSLNFDLITYKWLLKALDNIEEIQPDLIFVSANEYPRHWKTLVQFVKSGIGGKNIAIYLYNSTALSDDDNKKALSLGINGILLSFEKENIEEIRTNINTIFGNPDKKDKIEVFEKGEFLLTNPNTNSLMTGTFNKMSEEQFELLFDYDFTSLNIGNVINNVTCYDENDFTVCFRAVVSKINLDNNSVVLDAKEFYEEC